MAMMIVRQKVNKQENSTEHFMRNEDQKPIPSKEEKDKPSGNQGQNNLVELTIVVSGEETTTKANLNNKLRKAIEDALKETGNDQARPFEDWRVRYNDTPITDLDKKIEEYRFAPGVAIYVSVDSGTGGNGTI